LKCCYFTILLLLLLLLLLLQPLLKDKVDELTIKYGSTQPGTNLVRGMSDDDQSDEVDDSLDDEGGNDRRGRKAGRGADGQGRRGGRGSDTLTGKARKGERVCVSPPGGGPVVCGLLVVEVCGAY
jgi:hypothetical protein